MTDTNKIVLQLIQENKSLKEICGILNISEKQLYIRIKQLINYGYQLVPTYCYNADIYYKLEKGIYVTKPNELNIKMTNSDKKFRCIFISDLHNGNISSNLDLAKIVYEYASKNDIRNIFICGDFLEGIHSSDKKSIVDIYTQLETFIKKYPYDKNINNYGIFGNHDYHSMHYDGLDISKRIGIARYDIVPIGYGSGLIKIKNDNFLIKHELSMTKNPKFLEDPKVIILGHGHMMKTKVYEKLYIGAPSLSYVSPDKTKQIIPGFIDMTFHLEKGKFEFVEVHHMIITPKVYEASVSRCRIKHIYKN